MSTLPTDATILPAGAGSEPVTITPLPVWPDPAWDEAYLRVESYLRAHQLESRILLNNLVAAIVREAQRRAPQQPGLEPVALAMQVANERLAAWFDRVLADEDLQSHERLSVRGRLALTIADVPGRWPQYLLQTDQLPEDMRDAMRTAYIEAGPELQFSNMAPRPIDLGPIANVAGETWETFLRWPALRAVVGWSLIVGSFATLWVLTR